MTEFEKRQNKIDLFTTRAIKAKNRLIRVYWVAKLRLAQMQMSVFMRYANCSKDK